jgi:AcrR family transcriptional regulator
MSPAREGPPAASVLAAARTVLGRDRGASLTHVAEAAGVSRATVYRLFGSREGLLQALELEPDPDSRERILAAALELVGRDGLSRLSMDEVAAEAGVSRASLYRLFPGKPALFREVVWRFSPLEMMASTVRRLYDRPPAETMPELARAAVRALAGREGMLRSLLFEVLSVSPESAEAAEFALGQGVGPVIVYVRDQMEAGTLRRMNPILAVQGFAGPLLFHLLTRALMERRLGVRMDPEDAATQLAEGWVRAMRPDGGA